MLSLGLATALLLTTNVNAQGILGNLLDDYYTEQDQSSRNGGVIHKSTSDANHDGGMKWSDGGMIAQDPTEQSPLGSGLMLLMATGVGYAIVKSKNGKEEQR